MEWKAPGECSLFFERELQCYIGPGCQLFHAIYFIFLDFCHLKKLFPSSMCSCNYGNHEVIKRNTVNASVAHQDRQMLKY